MQRLILLALSLASVCNTSANPFDVASVNNKPLFLFMENLGQVHGTDNQSAPQVLYQLGLNGANVSLMQHKIHYTFYKAVPSNNLPAESENAEANTGNYELAGMDITLVGANDATEVTGEHEQNYCENYYTIIPGKAGGVGHVRSFDRIVYHNVYPSIDLVVYAPKDEIESGVKYEFIVREGGNAADIQLKYSNYSSRVLQQDGSLVTENEFGKLNESAPYCFIRETGLELPATIEQAGTVVSYKVPAQQKGTVVIVPRQTWIADSKAGNSENPKEISGYQGDSYIVGGSYDVRNLVLTCNEKIQFHLVRNAYLMRLSADGSAEWASYFGGNAENMAHAVVVDTTSGSIYICGLTSGANAAPVTENYQTILKKGGEGFVASFSPAGSLIQADFYGAAIHDFNSNKDDTRPVTGSIIPGTQAMISKPVGRR